MDDSANSPSSYAPLNANPEAHFPVSSDGFGDPPPSTTGSSWFSRSNSMPKSSSSGSATATTGKFVPSAWAKNFQTWTSSSGKEAQSSGTGSPSAAKAGGFNLFNNIGFGKQGALKIPVVEAPLETSSAPSSPSVESGPFNSIRNGFLSTSRNAVKAVQTKARHMVSQNKRRYQEGGFDLDMTYITENIIAMGFPAGDMSSGFFGYVEGFYRNHMEEVIKFFETQHKGKYKVYNLCSERLYDASLFEGKVACFPFDDHNCPPLQLIYAFCQSAYDWLKGDLENVVVVHCKAGMARTGLMICCLLLYLKFFPTCEESISYYNQKRCVDGKGLVLPSQLRYVKYFERVLRDYGGETPTGRKCILRGIRLHRCPYWVRPAIVVSDHNGVLFSTKKHPRTKDMMSEDIWFAAPRKGVMVFALPGERCIADINGDFKVHFQDRQGDFYCWLNTNMMDSRQILTTADLDGFDKRRLPSPGFQVEVVVLDHDAPLPSKSRAEETSTQSATIVQGATQTNSEDGPTSDVGQAQAKDEGTIGDGLRNAMDRIGISQTVGWTSVGGNTPPSASDGSLTSRATEESKSHDGLAVGGASGKTSVQKSVFEVGEADGAPANQEQPGSFHDKKSESSAGKGVDSGHGDKIETVGADSKREEVRLDSSVAPSDFKAIAVASAADPSVFTFGDDEDFESDED
ncbi:phosphatidylinositol-3,4,5-trisphosphate 3-phosphatase and dual-specificity protein phosphatase PTEN [Marchantia polymorpha subsp. ruderalis]|uniref:Phosphatidylinositol-3,4,5-trisphosphate 3-phosphatase n=2 Tax=Marchantia polymorpha TaxID=3197 RepID=A0AAF6BQX2_MARPO|nr:hypothetical protein MARPO_0016s0179 [Marchantia polymorpha]BBN14406.1 hypothetical protein Mp_6g11400 [Marchantia polymorpha subsp. ruderalis]|eukprot:PTQ45139.1 hypothetical protein MARPO_0016s0179 [Marchantia polymorpha]